MLPLARPHISEEEIAAHRCVLQSGRLVDGPENLAFAQALSPWVGGGQVVPVSSGAAALHLLLWALELKLRPGAEIMVPAFTFPSPAFAAELLGYRVVPVDVDPDTWNLAPEQVACRFTPRTVGIIAVDQFGLCSDYAKLEPLAAQAGVLLVEDAACAVGAHGTRGRAAGSFGVGASLSFHPRKIITTGEGGAVVTADATLADRVRALGNHGQWAPGKFNEVGTNYRMPEVAAAMGCVQLTRLLGFLAERERLVQAYCDRLRQSFLYEHLSMQKVPDGHRHAWQTFAVRLPEGTDRAVVIAKMRSQQIETGPATYALHRMGAFAGRPGFTAKALPVADALHDRGLALPLWNGMQFEAIDRVVSALEDTLR